MISKTSRIFLTLAALVPLAVGCAADHESRSDDRAESKPPVPVVIPLSDRVIQLTSNPDDVVVDAASKRAYTTVGFDGIVEIDTTTFSVVDQFADEENPLVGDPHHLAIDAHSGILYATARESVVVIDLATNQVAARIEIDGVPRDIAVDPVTHLVYTANRAIGSDIDAPDPPDGSISVIDPATRTVTANIPVEGEPVSLGIDGETQTVYAAHNRGRSLTIIDGRSNTVTGAIDLGDQGSADDGEIAFDSKSRTLYVINGGAGPLYAIDAASNTVTARIDVGDHPKGVAVDPDIHTVYVTHYLEDGYVSVIDTESNAVVGRIEAGTYPGAIAVDVTTHSGYVGIWNDHTVYAFQR
ncbi:YncE family protein [Antrihabitans sp. YC2-6]|uniref:YncE family protein n=1 Tax=Antrihabitans sp. YC2-6 TaxID=2799498 RepID=UPI0018F7AA7F|nr:YncE family protein [Antrihabitans sp. YC2-6]MBJ8345508.1 YncE family protein [Antrihabitans sp. YC2-6]